MKMSGKNSLFAVAFVVGMVALAVPAQASLIVSDTFTRADGPLLGSTPAPVSGPGTWAEATSSGGSIVGGSVTLGWGNSFIPIGTVQSGGTYTVSADIVGGGYWWGLGFNHNTTETDVWSGLIWRTDGGVGQWAQWENGYSYGFTPGVDATKHNYALVLDTTVPSAWTFSVKVDGSPLFGPLPCSNAIAYTNVEFNSNGGGATLDNVLVTSSFTAVPEPASTLSLLGLIGGGFLLRQRPRNK